MTQKTNLFPRVMKGTALLSALAASGLFGIQAVFPRSWVLAAAITALTVCYHFTMRLLVGYLVPWIAGRSRLAALAWYGQKPFEKKLYQALRVKQWKTHMPTYDPASFSLADNTLEQVVENSCISETVHEVIVVFSFLPLLFALVWEELAVFLITSILAALFDSMFVMMQRYNRPRLQRILTKKEGHRP